MKNRVQPTSLVESHVTDALARVSTRDAGRGRDAEHVYDALTWGEGPAGITQAVVQDWLWYRLPNKYLTDEDDYMAVYASVAAEFFDELGLDFYAAICRSDMTAAVHGAFGRSDAAGFAALRKARTESGIDPPNLDDFEWGSVMGMDEANARSTVEYALEQAIAEGEFAPSARGWKAAQARVMVREIDAENPMLLGQSLRTTITTERLSRWVDEPTRRCEGLSQMRGRVANRLLHPQAVPTDVVEGVGAITWLLTEFGDAQPLTAVGYLNPPFVRHVHATMPWTERYGDDKPPRTETDLMSLHRLRWFLERIAAWRKQAKTLRRTALGSAMCNDPVLAWKTLCAYRSRSEWDRFAFETCALVIVDSAEPLRVNDVMETVAEYARQLGWSAERSGDRVAGPSSNEVRWASLDIMAILELCGLLVETGDWNNRMWELSAAGVSTLLAMIRNAAVGPRGQV